VEAIRKFDELLCDVKTFSTIRVSNAGCENCSSKFELIKSYLMRTLDQKLSCVRNENTVSIKRSYRWFFFVTKHIVGIVPLLISDVKL